MTLTSTEDLLNHIEDIIGRALDKRLVHPSTTPQKEWLSTREAQEYLGGVSKATLARWRRDGNLKFTKVGNVLAYRRSDLDAFLAQYSR